MTNQELDALLGGAAGLSLTLTGPDGPMKVFFDRHELQSPVAWRAAMRQDIAIIECRHRQHAHVEDRIRDDKDTGLSKFPFKEFALNKVWLEIVMLAHDLIVWTQALVLDGELAKAEPKRLRYRLLHVAGRLAFSGRRAKLHL